MAQLATCPHCTAELLLPASAPTEVEGKCPHCGESVHTTQAVTRRVAELIVTSGSGSIGEEVAEELQPPMSTYRGTTLATFLRDAEEKFRSPEKQLERQFEKQLEKQPESQPGNAELPIGSRQTVSDLDSGELEFDSSSDDWSPEEEMDSSGDFDPERESALASSSAEADQEQLNSEADEQGGEFAKFTLPETFDSLPEVDTSEWREEAPSESRAASPSPETGNTSSDTRPPARSVARRRRSKKSGVGFLIKVVLGGVVGVWLAYPIALWISVYALGRSDEPMPLAQYYPNVMLPAVFQHGSVGTGNPKSGVRFESPPPAPRREPAEQPQRETPPAPLEGPTDRFALPEAPPMVESPVIQLKQLPEYNLGELEAALAEVHQYSTELMDGSYADPALQPVKRKAYANLARVAHLISCLDPAVSGHSVADAARQIFPPLLDDPRHRAEVSLICRLWVDYKPRTHGGIFFSGTPDEGLRQGSVVEFQFQTPEGKSLTVLVPEKLDPDTYRNAISVGVVGELLNDAPLQLEGYTGSTKRAVWGAYLFPIVAP